MERSHRSDPAITFQDRLTQAWEFGKVAKEIIEEIPVGRMGNYRKHCIIFAHAKISEALHWMEEGGKK